MPLLETRASASAQGYGLFGATSTSNFFLIQQLTPSAVSTITFNSIPSTYKSLQVRFNLIPTNSTNWEMQFNGDSSTANYAMHWLYGTGSAVVAGGLASGTIGYIQMAHAGQVLTYPSVGMIDIIDYANASKNKTVKVLTGGNNNTATGQIDIDSGLWLSTSAITSLAFFVGAGTFTGTISLYGVS